MNRFYQMLGDKWIISTVRYSLPPTTQRYSSIPTPIPLIGFSQLVSIKLTLHSAIFISDETLVFISIPQSCVNCYEQMLTLRNVVAKVHFPSKNCVRSSLRDLMGLFTACYCLCSWRWWQHWCPTIAALVAHFSSKVTSWMAVATHILCQLISFFAWLVYINSQRFQRPLQCMYMYIYSSFQANWSALVEELNNTSVKADWVVSMIFLIG